MKILSIALLMIILLGTTACMNKPYDYLRKRDYDGLKKEVLKNPNFIKRKDCNKQDYYCMNRNYFSVTDYLSMYTFVSEDEDADLLRFLLLNGAPISNKDFTSYYREPLYRALQMKKNKLAKVLVEFNETEVLFDINNLTYEDSSALIVAATVQNNKDMIEYLISKKADVNKVNNYKISPLEVALSISNNEENIATLLNNNAIYKLKNKLAFSYYHLSNLAVLVNHGISILDDNDFIYYSPYKQTRLSKVMKTYLKGINADLTLEGVDYLRKIHILLLSNDNKFFKQAVNLCLEKNENCSKYIDSLSYFGYSPLVIAAFYNNFKLMEFLLQKGANINKQNKFFQTALHISILLKKKEAIKILLKYGADTTIKDIRNNSPEELYKKLFKKNIK